MAASPTSSEVAVEQEILAKRKHDNLFKEIDEIETEERARTSSAHKSKKLLRTKPVIPSRSTEKM